MLATHYFFKIMKLRDLKYLIYNRFGSGTVYLQKLLKKNNINYKKISQNQVNFKQFFYRLSIKLSL